MRDEAEFAKVTEALGPDWHGVYGPLVDELLTLRRLAGDCLARYEENPAAQGSRGQAVKHPELEMFVAVSTRAMLLAETLLLTPRARKRAAAKAGEPAEDLISWLHHDGGGA